MTPRLCFIVAASALSAPVLATADEPADARAAIRTVLDDQAAAWNRGDLEGFMKGYWQSPDLTFFSGKNKTKGWQATLERYRKKYGTGKDLGKLTFGDLEIEVLGREHAFVRGRWNLALPGGGAGGLFTLVVRKLDAGWRIIHDHTSS